MVYIDEDDPCFNAGRDGLYAIMCFNKNQYSEVEIKEDFSKFGEIVNFRQLPSGSCFIRYAQKNQLIHCYKEMSENNKYNIRIPKSSLDEDGNKESGPWHVKHDNSSRGGKIGHHNKFKHHYQTQEPKNYDQDHFNGPHSKSGPRIVSHDEPPPLINLNEFSSRSQSSPPPLLLRSNLTWEKELKKLHEVNAVEVVVANVPTGIYQSEVYELCRKGRPIHIEMDTTPDPYKIKYATVYVRTLKHAQTLISELNGMLLENNLLVVSLADTIIGDSKE